MLDIMIKGLDWLYGYYMIVVCVAAAFISLEYAPVSITYCTEYI